MDIAEATHQVKKALVRRLVIEQQAYRRAESGIKKEMAAYFRWLHQAYLRKAPTLNALHEWVAIKRKIVNPVELRTLTDALRQVVTGDEEELERILETALVTGYNLGGRRAIVLLGTRGNFELRNGHVMEFLQKHAAEQVTRIDEHTRERVARAIISAADEDVGMPGVYRNLRHEFEQFGTKRSRMIARTELAFASGHARQEVFTRSRVKLHEWVTAGDELVGLGHTECKDNEAAGSIRVGAYFPSGVTAEPAHPNCRCTTLPIVSEDFEPSELWDGR